MNFDMNFDFRRTADGVQKVLEGCPDIVGSITPKDMLAGRQPEIHAERDRELEDARKQRQVRRQQAV